MGALIEAWDEAHREFDVALGGLPGDELWRRPHPRLLSVGELAGHVAYWQAVWVLDGGDPRPDLASLPIRSPLVDNGFRYYTSNVECPLLVEMGTQELLDEVRRVHEAVRTTVVGLGKDDPYPGQWGTWGSLVQYQAFHVAYHTGQTYSVRHLLGHATEDN